MGRVESFAHEGRTAIAVALGLVAVLFVSGFIEGFVTPSGLPTWARIGIGVVVESLFLAYVFVVGPGGRARAAPPATSWPGMPATSPPRAPPDRLAVARAGPAA